MNEKLSPVNLIEPKISGWAKSLYFGKWFKSERFLLIILLALTILSWAPRLSGPLDLRWDGGVYYILGTALAEGKGYKLLNEPGEIDAVQYPPLLPAIIAGHQLMLGTNDPTIVGHWLRLSAFLIFIVYIYVAYRLFKNYLSVPYAFFATVLCLFTVHVYYISDLLFPEVLFGLATLLFILFNQKKPSLAFLGPAYLFAVFSYGLRTIGITALAAWVLESLLDKQFKQAVFKAILVLIPIFCWQFYIASIEQSFAYNHPVYVYQRAPYMFYNVAYARNVALVDPFAPEKGNVSSAKIAQRFIDNALRLPESLGETLTIPGGYWQKWIIYPLNETTIGAISSWGVFLFLNLIGLFLLGGLAVQLFQREWMIPLYVLIYLAALSLTPFPGQYLRYLMPITPLLILSLAIFLAAAKNSALRVFGLRFAKFGNYAVITVLSLTLIIKIIVFATVYMNERYRVSYLDQRYQPLNYRLFFYSKTQQNYDLCVDFARQHAKADEIIADATPHWIYLRTGLKAVMPPFEIDPAAEQQLLDSVPVSYLIVGKDVIGAERYTLPVVKQFPDQWKQVYSTPENDWIVYQRLNR